MIFEAQSISSLWDVDQVAKFTGYSIQHVRKLARLGPKKGGIPAVKRGTKKWFFHPADVKAHCFKLGENVEAMELSADEHRRLIDGEQHQQPSQDAEELLWEDDIPGDDDDDIWAD